MLAYVHRFLSGFVPCKVLGRSEDGTHIRAKLTATRGPWKRGEVVTIARGEVVARPLRRSRQSIGSLYSYSLSDDVVSALPVFPASNNNN